MVYVPDRTPSEGDPPELRERGRILGAPFNRVRAELCACTRRPVLSFVAPWVLMRQAVCLYGLTCEKRMFVGRSQFSNAPTHDYLLVDL